MAHPQKLSLLNWTFLSKYLGRQQSLNILLPYGCYSDSNLVPPRPFKVLWLLHGKSDDYQTWLRSSIIENLARKYQLAVVMPDGGNSFYSDMINGQLYYSYITEELPELLTNLLPLSTKKEDNYIAGLSMGGYGALKIGLNQPERFFAIGSFSGAVDICKSVEKTRKAKSQLKDIDFKTAESIRLFDSAFGNEEVNNTNNDLFYLIKQFNKDNLPHLFITCGEDDFLFEDNKKFVEALKNENHQFEYTWMEGEHTWEVWNKSIEMFISYLESLGAINKYE